MPPRRLLRTPVNEICSDGWLHRGQELAVHKEAFLLSQTGAASRQRGKEEQLKGQDISPDSHTGSEASDASTTTQPSTSITTPALMSEEKRQKFKYEPLEDNSDCLRGMLFEQDLYGCACSGTYTRAKFSTQLLSINAEEAKCKVTSFSGSSRMLSGSLLPVKDLLSLSSLPSKASSKVLDVSSTQMETTKSSPPKSTPTNNISVSLNLGDLNMNVTNSDFSLVASESNADTLKCTGNCGDTVPKLSLKASGNAEAPQDVFTLRDTYITGVNTSFEITTSMDKQGKASLVSQPRQCELSTVGPQNQASTSPALDSGADTGGYVSDLKKTPDFDDNGNLQSKTSAPNQTGWFSGVTSARIRPKCAPQQSNNSSPNNQNNRENREFEQLLCLVQSISGANEGPLSYQPVNSALSSILACKSQSNLQGDHANEGQSHPGVESHSQLPPPSNNNTPKSSQVSFEDLHAKVAPHRKTSSKAELGSASPSISSASSTLHDPQAEPHPTPLPGPTLHSSSTGPRAEARTALTVAPSSSSSSSTATSNTDQSLVDALHSLLPEETQPASNLPHLESR